MRDLGFSYDGGPPLIDGLTFAVGRRDRIGVIGKNGKGKTTLLNLLAGDLNPDQGVIGRAASLRCGYFGQANIDRLDGEATIEEEILQATPDLSRGAARNICGFMLFEGDQALKKIAVLSGGEKSRVLLGKMLVAPANLLLLDEPTNHLDMESVDSLIEAVDAFEGAVVLATHSEMILHAVAERLIVFDGGKPWLFEGTYRDFLERVGWQDEQTAATGTGRIDGRIDKERQRAEKKELKRMRAAIIAERSRLPLAVRRADIAAGENDHGAGGARWRRTTSPLVRATQAGQGKTIAALSISIHEARKRIDEAFGELEAASKEHLSRAREFEARLEALGADRSRRRRAPRQCKINKKELP